MINYFELMRVLDDSPIKEHVVLDFRGNPWLSTRGFDLTKFDESLEMLSYMVGLMGMGLRLVEQRWPVEKNCFEYKLRWSPEPTKIKPENKFELVMS